MLTAEPKAVPQPSAKNRPRRRPGSPHAAKPSAEVENLRRELREALETIESIRSGGAERTFRLLVESMGEGAATVSPAGVILYANLCLHAMVGRSKASLIGTDVFGLVDQGDRATLARALEADAEDFFPYEVRLATTGGSRPIVLVSASAIEVEGDLVRCLVVRDISGRKRRTNEVGALNLELERRAAELAANNRELETFSYSVSHDLRAPLRSIDSFSRILIDEHADQLDAEGQRVLGIVSRNARVMSTLIDDLLAFSRVALRAPDLQPTDMEPLVNEVVASTLLELEPYRPIDFEIKPLGRAACDTALMRQVWLNLIGNAVKFTRREERPSIEVACEVIGGERRYTVRDNGAGFDPAFAAKLFQPFQRLHRSTEFEGTGIGLAIVARIVRRHGGRVWAEGVPGAGALFGFSLPEQAALPLAEGGPA